VVAIKVSTELKECVRQVSRDRGVATERIVVEAAAAILEKPSVTWPKSALALTTSHGAPTITVNLSNDLYLKLLNFAVSNDLAISTVLRWQLAKICYEYLQPAEPILVQPMVPKPKPIAAANNSLFICKSKMCNGRNQPLLYRWRHDDYFCCNCRATLKIEAQKEA
jgi:hypothetical protein